MCLGGLADCSRVDTLGLRYRSVNFGAKTGRWGAYLRRSKVRKRARRKLPRRTAECASCCFGAGIKRRRTRSEQFSRFSRLRIQVSFSGFRSQSSGSSIEGLGATGRRLQGRGRGPKTPPPDAVSSVQVMSSRVQCTQVMSAWFSIKRVCPLELDSKKKRESPQKFGVRVPGSKFQASSAGCRVPG